MGSLLIEEMICDRLTLPSFLENWAIWGKLTDLIHTSAQLRAWPVVEGREVHVSLAGLVEMKIL